MILRNLNEFASIISDGFLVDRILNGEYRYIIPFVIDVKIGREIVESGKLSFPNVLVCLRRYNWFMEWLLKTYGKMECKNKKEAKEIINEKIRNISNMESIDGESFWRWLQLKTLSKCSELLSR